MRWSSSSGRISNLWWPAVVLLACGGFAPEQAVTSQAIGISIAPDRVTLAAGGQRQLTATVTGLAGARLDWSVAEGSGGGSVSGDGLYTAPASAGSYHVVANVAGHPEASATATVTITRGAASLVLSPTQASVPEGGTLAFTATVDGSTEAVTWSVVEGASGGSIDATGRYTAPRAAGTWHVVATSQADPSLTATSAITVTAIPVAPVTVTITPATATVQAGSTVQFAVAPQGSTTPVVTWAVAEGASGGSVSSSGLYTAPLTAGVYHLVVTSVADPSATATATVTVTAVLVQPVTVTVTPATATVQAGSTVQFGATSQGSSAPAVTWTVAEGASGGTVNALGLYTAPLSAGVYHVVATSAIDPTARSIATVTVTAVVSEPITLTVTPATATLQVKSTLQFAVTSQDNPAPPVTWTIAEGFGKISATGLYTATSIPGVYHVIATSSADPSATSTATVTVMDGLGENLIDRGGPVLATPRVYMIWWGDQALLASPKTAVESFIADLEGSSYLGTSEQYLRGAKPHVSLAGQFYDPHIPAKAFGTDLHPEVCSIIAASGQPIDPLGVYVLVTSFFVNVGGAGGHSDTVCNGVVLREVWIRAEQGIVTACPTADWRADSVVETFSHELLETMTEPGPGRAWQDPLGQEIGDKCNYSTCEKLGTRYWPVNPLWSNAAGACVSH